jgi:hypothetical protein
MECVISTDLATIVFRQIEGTSLLLTMSQKTPKDIYPRIGSVLSSLIHRISSVKLFG